MKNLVVNLKKVPEDIRPGLKEIAKTIPLKFSGKGIKVNLSQQAGGLEISAGDSSIDIAYEERNDVFRGLALVLARPIEEIREKKICEFRRIRKCFVMLDVSRNGVLNTRSVNEWLHFMALAGINGFMFYTEDTYEIKDEPLFGYMRGAYSEKELRNFDAVADALGIEMIPCIQTLAHLQRILQYGRFDKIKDTQSVMLCEEPETFKFIEKMLKAATAPYKSDRIHIGMDEAWDLGRGNYLSRNGYKDPFAMMTEHLAKVLELTESLNLKPMMWSDMFFRALSETGEYYDPDVKFTDEIIKQVPQNVDLVYWDYYHNRESDYTGMIDRHIQLGGIPIMAPGIHTWNRFWAAYSHSEETMKSAIKGSISKNVKEMIITIWGDDGTECDYFSAWPLIQYASDIIFTGKENPEQTSRNIKGAAGIDYDAWKTGEGIDRLPGNKGNSNISKALLWDDPLLGLWQAQKNGRSLNDHYEKLARKLKKLCRKKSNRRLMLPLLLSELLALKADFPEILQQAYLNKDRRKLKKILSETLPEIIKKVKKLNRYHRQLWQQNYKSFGWEVIERRYGGLLGVLDNLKYKLNAYLNGEIPQIEELEAEKYKIQDSSNDSMANTGASRVYSTGHITH